MDFFESQDIARRNTRYLLFLFFLAVALLVALSNLLVFVFINFQNTATVATGAYYYTWEMFVGVSLAVVLLVLIASGIRLLVLKKGGSAIAEMLDGELLVDPGDDLNKRKLLNVVAEMAIASGTPVPPVYLINEHAINAFAAGYSPGDAVIGVTYGAIENLNRDELQGVVAHEFSHILNGDMRLNIRLMGILYGILMLALVGRMILSPGRAGAAASRSRSHAGVMALGAGLMAIGYIGQFFGNLIKAAVSRQREFLADASAVQFTRNPDGIAGALKRIGGYTDGSVLTHPESAEMSHTFFSEGVTFAFSGLMATHPPLEERIKRIEPRWDGQYLQTTSTEPVQGEVPAGAMGFASGTGVGIDADDAVAHVGNPDVTQLEAARNILGSIPAPFNEAAREPYSARALVYLLQLSRDNEVRETQLERLKEAADLGVYASLERLLEVEDELTTTMRLPLLELAFPTLRQLSYEQYKLFSANLDVLIRADGRVGLSEWAVQKMIRKHLGEVFEGVRSSPKYNNLKPVKKHCEVLLSLLAYCDKQSKARPEDAFAAGQREIELDISLQPKSALNFKTLNQALDTLANLHPLRKPKLLKACIKTITADQVVSDIETELLRTIADTLECPLPPLHNIPVRRQ